MGALWSPSRDNVRLERNDLGYEVLQRVDVSAPMAGLDPHILVLSPALVLQRLGEDVIRGIRPCSRR